MPVMTCERASIQSKASDLTQLNFGHLDCLLSDIGLWQHAEGCIPHQWHGYSIDDEARGLIVGLRYWELGIEPRLNERLARVCYQFIEDAANSDGRSPGRYHNFCNANGHWLDSVGSDDSFGRTLWGLGVAHAVNSPIAPRWSVEKLLRNSLPAISKMEPNYLRARAFVILGLAASRIADNEICLLADSLADAYQHSADENWRWFEDQMTYCNPRLPQALFIAARIFPDNDRYREIGTNSLDFLLQKTRNEQGSYNPIGNLRLTEAGWFTRADPHPPRFDQQPVDAGALVECCVDAYKTTGEPRFRQAAWDAFGWYFGKNTHGLHVYNPETGGVSDALTPFGLNRNQGAESVLSVHMAYLALLTI